MDVFLQWLSTNSLVATIIIVTLCLSLTAIVIMYLVAFFQGREISFYPPKIGQKPLNDVNTNPSKKDSKKVNEYDVLELQRLKSDMLRKIVKSGGLTDKQRERVVRSLINDVELLESKEKMELLGYLVEQGLITAAEERDLIGNLITDSSKSRD